MLRATTGVFCLLLAGAAAGRYHAEIEVRETEAEIRALTAEAEEERRTIQMLRSETAMLDSPEQLRDALRDQGGLGLRPLSSRQMLDAEGYVARFGGTSPAAPEAGAAAPAEDAIVMHALALVERDARR